MIRCPDLWLCVWVHGVQEDEEVHLRQGPSSAPTSSAWGQPAPSQRPLVHDSEDEEDEDRAGRRKGSDEEDEDEESDEGGVVLRPRATGFQPVSAREELASLRRLHPAF